MSIYKPPHQQRLDLWIATLNAINAHMNRHTEQVIRDMFASLLVAGIILQTGQGVTVGLFAIGAINTLTVADVVEAVRKANYEQKQELQGESTE